MINNQDQNKEEIFYFHGFASSNRSWKVQMLQEHLAVKNIRMAVPTLPPDPAEVIELFAQHVQEKGKPALLIGSSLGGFYARYMSGRYDIPTVLINPSIVPWFSLAGCAGMHNRYYSGEPFEWKAQYLDTLKKMNEEMKQLGPIDHLLHFFLATDDEILDHKKIPNLFPHAASIRYFDHCQHSFTRFAELIPDIDRLLNLE